MPAPKLGPKGAPVGRQNGRSLPTYWILAGAWYVDRDFIRQVPGAEDRAKRISAVYPGSFTTIKRYGTMYKKMTAALRASSEVPSVPPVPSPASPVLASAPLLEPAEDMAPAAAAVGASADPCVKLEEEPSSDTWEYYVKHGSLLARPFATDLHDLLCPITLELSKLPNPLLVMHVRVAVRNPV
ncbi:hypothetical protein T484DRAFT_1905159 [Baffinella frigidus]|nr:hypothetical protein T484DRAFT_1905159 [Cryptophyta sp. CCMP2293]